MLADSLIKSTISKLIEEAAKVDHSKHKDNRYHERVDIQLYAKWTAGCRNLLQMIGKKTVVFEQSFEHYEGAPFYGDFQRAFGTLQAIQESVDNNLLVSVEGIAFAEAFSDMIEQAEELASKGYLLAAGVICRAVFEEHLRKLCDLNSCLPPGKPTIEMLKQSLVKSEVLNRLDAKNVDAIGGEGNYCAHNNQPPLEENAVKGLIQKVQNFLIQHPLR